MHRLNFTLSLFLFLPFLRLLELAKLTNACSFAKKLCCTLYDEKMFLHQHLGSKIRAAAAFTWAAAAASFFVCCTDAQTSRRFKRGRKTNKANAISFHE